MGLRKHIGAETALIDAEHLVQWGTVVHFQLGPGFVLDVDKEKEKVTVLFFFLSPPLVLPIDAVHPIRISKLQQLKIQEMLAGEVPELQDLFVSGRDDQLREAFLSGIEPVHDDWATKALINLTEK